MYFEAGRPGFMAHQHTCYYCSLACIGDEDFRCKSIWGKVEEVVHWHMWQPLTTLLTYKNPCILPYKNKKSLQFSSPIGFRLILHSHFGISDYLTSVHISKVIFQPYGQLYGHSAPSYIIVQWLWFTHTSDTVSSSTICPWFLASLYYTLCAASI